MTANIGLKRLELKKMYGIWRSKGFEHPTPSELRLTRRDCVVTFARKNWQCKDPDGNIIAVSETLRGVLNKVH
ncbi:hypothetical protein CYR55_23030 [Chimaeribacter californicus]|uniref:Uncharacterized protein n=1 Tax=Chimaeribacter californicus TaxID=2060067 RepID=A0A2N5DSN5_9GAMM|nr:hypothetical protein [Chimaeribacter californicus]PLR29115.1 hypothetical protein CYR55_23030 [Chimaeribacter californicus]